MNHRTFCEAKMHKVGPLPVISKITTPFIGGYNQGITPVTHLFSAIYTDPMSLHLELNPVPTLQHPHRP